MVAQAYIESKLTDRSGARFITIL